MEGAWLRGLPSTYSVRRAEACIPNYGSTLSVVTDGGVLLAVATCARTFLTDFALGLMGQESRTSQTRNLFVQISGSVEVWGIIGRILGMTGRSTVQ